MPPRPFSRASRRNAAARAGKGDPVRTTNGAHDSSDRSHRHAAGAATVHQHPRRDVLNTLLATVATSAAAASVAAIVPVATPPPAGAIGLPLEFGGLFGGSSPKSGKLPPNTVRDETLAYQFRYPSVSASGQEIPIVVSRKPERYSSAAPLTADARQRIVTELVCLQEGITYTVYVGPATGVLRGVPPNEWSATDVAKTVLTDRSASRNSQGQRIPLASVESATIVDHNGTPYYVYECAQQGSPNLFDVRKDTYRQSLCATAARAGQDGSPFLYTLALACPGSRWQDLEKPFREAIDSFELVQPGKKYVPPDKEPWRFF